MAPNVCTVRCQLQAPDPHYVHEPALLLPSGLPLHLRRGRRDDEIEGAPLGGRCILRRCILRILLMVGLGILKLGHTSILSRMLSYVFAKIV